MVESENAAIIRRWFEEGWNKRNGDLIDELFSTKFSAEGGPHGTLDRLSYKKYFETVIAASPDMVCELVELIDANEFIVSRIIATGTHFETVAGVEASGEKIVSEIIDVWKVADGRIIERRNAHFDHSGISEQINQRIRFKQ